MEEFEKLERETALAKAKLANDFRALRDMMKKYTLIEESNDAT